MALLQNIAKGERMLYFATENKGKFERISSVLKEHGIDLEQKKMKLEEPESDSLREIALAKAKQAFEKIKQPLITEDTGCYFEAYKGFPGPHTKWAFEKLGYPGLFKLLSGKSKKCFFHSVICFTDSPESHQFFEAKWHGKITTKVSPKNPGSYPYSRIFIPEGQKITSVEMSSQEKNKISQRGIAAHALGNWLKEKALHDLIDSI